MYTVNSRIIFLARVADPCSFMDPDSDSAYTKSFGSRSGSWGSGHILQHKFQILFDFYISLNNFWTAENVEFWEKT